jgi:hypothetical protein
MASTTNQTLLTPLLEADLASTAQQYVGVIAGGFKPFHQGHWITVQKALSENSGGVVVFVSTEGRARPGEFEITGPRMLQVWETILIPALSSYNVTVKLTRTPILSVYQFLHEKKVEEGFAYRLYSGKDDAEKNFPGRRLQKNNPALFDAGLIEVVAVPRFGSGTKMRLALQLGLKEDFIAGLPDIIRAQGEQVWQMLGGDENAQASDSPVV